MSPSECANMFCSLPIMRVSLVALAFLVQFERNSLEREMPNTPHNMNGGASAAEYSILKATEAPFFPRKRSRAPFFPRRTINGGGISRRFQRDPCGPHRKILSFV
eukprot:3379232-Prymnesium_polylepis.1